MSPNKLFDYLDGKLPAREREELEACIAKNATLQRELAIARKLHDGMRDSSEVIGSIGPSSPGTVERGAILGRRIASAVIVLVFVNVLIGLWFIFMQEKKPASADRRDLQLRQQLEESAKRAAAMALPMPSLESDEIKIATPPTESDSMVSKVIAAATAAGGSGAKALSDENGIVVLVDIPKNREAEFRDQMVPLGAHLPTLDSSAKPTASTERKFLQIRIVSTSSESKP